MHKVHKTEFLRRKDELIRLAVNARKRANSHRGFYVGCAVLAYNGLKYKIFAGANLKPESDSGKMCSEEEALKNTRRDGFNIIIAIAVAGPNQEDGESGLKTTTLPPCGDCRRLFQDLKSVQDNTIVYTFCPDTGAAEQQTVGELIERHSKSMH